MKRIILLLFLLSTTFALNYTLSPDGQYVSWENANALINCTATSNELISQHQECNFTYKGSGNPTLNTSFVFNLADGVVPKKAYNWQNISHTLYHPVSTAINHSIQVNQPWKIQTTSAACQWGAGAIKRNITMNATNQSSTIYCIDSMINNSNNYTLYSVWNESVSTPYTSWFFDWNDITSNFEVSQFGSNKVGTIEATWSPNQTRQIRIDYDTLPNSQGKFDIYFHTGTAAQAKADPTRVKLMLDPWYNSSWAYKAPCYINTTISSSLENFPAHCSLNTSALISAGKMNSSCYDIRMLNSSEDGALPFEIENSTCNSAAYNTTIWVNLLSTNATGNDTVWVYYGNNAATDGQNVSGVWTNYITVLHMAQNNGVASLGPNATVSGSATNSTGRFGNSQAFDGTTATGWVLPNSTYSNIIGANFTLSIWFKNKPPGSIDADGGMIAGSQAASNTAFFKTGIYPGSCSGNDKLCYLMVGIPATNSFRSTVNISDGSFHLLQLYRNSSATGIFAFLDGVLDNSSSSANGNQSTSKGFGIGQQSGGTDESTSHYNGTIDEVRLSNNNQRTSDYLKAEYAQTDSIGAEETSNLPPSIVSLNLTPTVAYPTSTLNASFTINDSDSPTINATLYWFKNGTIQNSLNKTFEMIANATNSTLLMPGNLTLGDNWSFAVNATDGLANSSLNYSSNVTIRNIACGDTLTEAGTYTLASNLSCTGNGVVISGNNIALDLSGFTLSGDGGASDLGISSSSISNMTIRNGSISNFGNGIRLTLTNNSYLSNVSVSNSTDRAIYMDGDINWTHNNNTIKNSVGGYFITGASPPTRNLTISNSIITNISGFSCIRASALNFGQSSVSGWITNNTLTNCTYGMFLTADSLWMNVSGNTIRNMTTAGIWLNKSSSNFFYDNTIIDTPTGILLDFTGSHTFTNTKVYGGSVYINSTIVANSTFTDTTIGYNSSMDSIFWPNLNISNSAIKEGSNAFIQPDWVSVNSTALPDLNTPANITLNCTGSTAYIYYDPGFPTDKANITTFNRTESCIGGLTTFNVSGFTGYYSGNSTLSVDAILPANGSIFTGESITFQYDVATTTSLSCSMFVDGNSLGTRTVPSSQSVSIPLTIITGGHTWYATCDDGNTTVNSSTNSFTNYPASTSTIYLSNSSINITSTQSLFYNKGFLDLLYFLDGPTDTLMFKKINSSIINQSLNASLNSTKPFFLVMQDYNDTTILTFANTSALNKIFINLNSTAITPSTISTTFNATSNANYDPATYANTKHLTLNQSASSYYLFVLPTANGSRIITRPINSTNLTNISNVNHNRSVVWQTIANDSQLTTWYYTGLQQCNATHDRIWLYSYNGTNSTAITGLNNLIGCQNGNQAQIEASKVYFEKTGDMTFVMITGLTNRTYLYQIEANKTYIFNNTISNPSQMILIDEQTLVFFDSTTGSTLAYSCYFGGANVTCSNFSASQYGVAVPFSTGPMTASRLIGIADKISQGAIFTTAPAYLSLATNVYDVKYKCNAEPMWATRLQFTVNIYSNTTSVALNSSIWGYAIPSSTLGTGTQSVYFLCQNGVQRELFSGINGSYALNFYSLDNISGVYYTFTVKDAYGQLIQGVRVSAYRYNTDTNTNVVIAQGESDFTGTVVLYLQPYVPYTLVVEDNNYATISSLFTPSSSTNPIIQLSSNTGNTVVLPNWNYEANDISWSVLPVNSTMYKATNITFQISSSHSLLEWWGFNVVYSNFTNKTTICTANISASPSGGTGYCAMTSPGIYTIYPFWKSNQNNSVKTPMGKQYIYSNGSAWNNAFKTFQTSEPISPWTLYAIALICAMLVGGWVAQYSIDGAGLGVLAVLWFFTFFNPAGCLLEITTGICMTTFAATLFTTIATLGALFLVKYL